MLLLTRRILLFALLPLFATAQHIASIKEYKKSYKTYPFSDPDPVAGQRIYPYFRYDGFTDKSQQQDWKVVELENDYIRLMIMPEIGGKIWTAIDKQTGKSFLYENDVVKFRDIAMRGPWTSGGIESNYGIIGHTPNCATPVDYLVRKNSDGSASCFISTLDLLTRTKWTVEIRLPADKAYFTTRSTWHNATPFVQPYYSWSNVGIPVGNDLEFLYPGNHYIGHDGKPGPWPVDSAHGKQLSLYAQNDFGADKSFHVLGVHSNYFGAYWKQQDAGMIRYASREDKLGKKIFLWALSDQGKIWEQLLTDKSGQYCEIQSGRLFNQNVVGSSHTPFRQTGFQPYATDSWEEYWYPFSGTDGFTDASLQGVIHAKQAGSELSVVFSPVVSLIDTLKVYDANNHLLYHQAVQLQPLQTARYVCPLPEGARAVKIVLRDMETSPDGTATPVALERPLARPEGFNEQGAYGLYLMGRDQLRFRDYAGGESKIRQALDIDPYFVPALTEMSFIHYRKLQYDSAFYCAKLALSIDTYDAGANYHYALAAAKLGRFYDALDGLEVAALTPSFRSAAYTALSKMYLQKNDGEKAIAYAVKSCVDNSRNISGLLLRAVASRRSGKLEEARAACDSLLTIDPLCHFAHFEQYLQHKDEAHKAAFRLQLRNELPHETYLEMAAWYSEMGLTDDARILLDLAPAQSEILYWKAYLHQGDADVSHYIAAADSSSAMMVFPFREESVPVMQWAMAYSRNWKPSYYLALIYLFRNDSVEAMKLLKAVPASVHFAPMYALRARLYAPEDAAQRHADLARAAQIAPEEWRYGKMLTEQQVAEKSYDKALGLITTYHRRTPENYIIGMLYIRCLVLNKQYAAAERALADSRVLPYEGAMEGQRLYRKVKLLLAIDAIGKQRYGIARQKIAEARLWPLHLGAGAPYPSERHEQQEDALDEVVAGGKHTVPAELQQAIEAM
ncbi:Tfp pilus assembly protein PilF [Chitinophaga polysaccharea]|uniref:Tfp pilus assembly protein PilF n=1 Tax=Chitinophaga polysaccharea TaxID=1293035 RepID=A0A561P6D7_9BACT|nr:DUF5107 domain-containing protein [Chitinophaga polysaccharea]TWF33678.1 Tfp pilus assembly protein PilF [Chitinophaga polysaccharea]